MAATKEPKRMKVAFAASSGGHYEQLLRLLPLMKECDSFVVTERTKYGAKTPGEKTYYMRQVNRREVTFIPRMIANAISSCGIVLREHPDAVICTGVLAMIPLCLLVKLCGGRLVYIESFAKISSPTLTGKLLYRFADRFYVQWETMREFYPDAICLGGIY